MHKSLLLDFGTETIFIVGAVLLGVILAVYRRQKVRVRQQTRMKPQAPLSGFAGQTLTWTQTVWGVNDYELHAGAQLVATLYFPPTWGVKRSAATGETSDGCWMFNSLWGGDASISTCGAANEVGRFTRDKRNTGAVDLPGGRQLLLVPLTNWMSRPVVREFQTGSGVPLVRLTSTPGMTRRSGTVLIHPAAANLPELPWAVILMWFLAIAAASDTYTST
jgi:hypothetical protein